MVAVLGLSIVFAAVEARSAYDLRQANILAKKSAEEARTNQAAAENAAKLAKENADEAKVSERQARINLAERTLERAQMYGEQKELGLGMPWLARSLDIAEKAGDAHLARAIRRNVSAWSESMHVLRVAKRYPQEIDAFVWHPDGRRFFMSAGPNVLQGTLKDSDLHDQLVIFRGSDALVHALATMPTGQVLVARGNEIYQLQPSLEGKPMIQRIYSHEANTPKGSIVALAASPRSPMPGEPTWGAFIDHQGQAWTWQISAANARPVLLDRKPRVLCLTFSPDGQSLLLGGADGVTRLFRLDATNPQEWTPDRVIPRAFPWLPSEEIKAAAFHPDGRRFLIARSTPLSGVAELWSIQEQKQPLATFAH